MSWPWDLSLENLDPIKEITQTTLLAHNCSLRLNDDPIRELQTGLLCDLDVCHLNPGYVRRLLAAGLTVARLDLRRIEVQVRSQLVQSIRRAVLEYSADLGFVYPLAVTLNVRGHDVTTGGLADAPVHLSKGSPIRLTTNEFWRECGTADCIFIAWDLLAELNPGDKLDLNSFKPHNVKLVVNSVDDDSVECTVTQGGSVEPHATVRVTQMPLVKTKGEAADSSDSLTQSDMSTAMEHVERQIAWAVQNDVDAVFIPAQNASDVGRIREILSDNNGNRILTLACIETSAAVDVIDEIIEVADGLYLDRSVLSFDLPVEQTFTAQKMLAARCTRKGKPFICRSVVNEQIPTLCVGDLAALVLDGVDVIALEINNDVFIRGDAATRSAEECLVAAGVVLREAEHIAYKPLVYGNLELMQSPLEDPSLAVCVSAVELAMRARAIAIVCVTTSGRSAKLLAHVGTPCPVVAVTRSCHAARQLRLWRGLRSLYYTEDPQGSWECELNGRVRAALRYLKVRGALHAGDAYVVLSCSRRDSGYTDRLRLTYTSVSDTTSN